MVATPWNRSKMDLSVVFCILGYYVLLCFFGTRFKLDYGDDLNLLSLRTAYWLQRPEMVWTEQDWPKVEKQELFNSLGAYYII